LSSGLTVQDLPLTTSSTAAFDDIHALCERAAVRYRFLQPASTLG
jgi:hypothetical protein